MSSPVQNIIRFALAEARSAEEPKEVEVLDFDLPR
jgi:hypothetical protein